MFSALGDINPLINRCINTGSQFVSGVRAKSSDVAEYCMAHCNKENAGQVLDSGKQSLVRLKDRGVNFTNTHVGTKTKTAALVTIGVVSLVTIGVVSTVAVDQKFNDGEGTYAVQKMVSGLFQYYFSSECVSKVPDFGGSTFMAPPAEYVCENPDFLMSPTDYVSENPDFLMSPTDYVSENPDFLMSPTDYVSENPDFLVSSNDYYTTCPEESYITSLADYGLKNVVTKSTSLLSEPEITTFTGPTLQSNETVTSTSTPSPTQSVLPILSFASPMPGSTSLLYSDDDTSDWNLGEHDTSDQITGFTDSIAPYLQKAVTFAKDNSTWLIPSAAVITAVAATMIETWCTRATSKSNTNITVESMIGIKGCVLNAIDSKSNLREKTIEDFKELLNNRPTGVFGETLHTVVQYLESCKLLHAINRNEFKGYIDLLRKVDDKDTLEQANNKIETYQKAENGEYLLELVEELRNAPKNIDIAACSKKLPQKSNHANNVLVGHLCKILALYDKKDRNKKFDAELQKLTQILEGVDTAGDLQVAVNKVRENKVNAGDYIILVTTRFIPRWNKAWTERKKLPKEINIQKAFGNLPKKGLLAKRELVYALTDIITLYNDKVNNVVNDKFDSLLKGHMGLLEGINNKFTVEEACAKVDENKANIDKLAADAKRNEEVKTEKEEKSLTLRESVRTLQHLCGLTTKKGLHVTPVQMAYAHSYMKTLTRQIKQQVMIQLGAGHKEPNLSKAQYADTYEGLLQNLKNNLSDFSKKISTNNGKASVKALYDIGHVQNILMKIGKLAEVKRMKQSAELEELGRHFYLVFNAFNGSSKGHIQEYGFTMAMLQRSFPKEYPTYGLIKKTGLFLNGVSKFLYPQQDLSEDERSRRMKIFDQIIQGSNNQIDVPDEYQEDVNSIIGFRAEVIKEFNKLLEIDEFPSQALPKKRKECTPLYKAFYDYSQAKGIVIDFGDVDDE